MSSTPRAPSTSPQGGITPVRPLEMLATTVSASPPYSQSLSPRLGKPGAPPPSEPWQVAQLLRNRLRPMFSAEALAVSSCTLRGAYGASVCSMRAALSCDCASCSVREVQLSVPFQVPSPGYSTKYTTPNTTVMMNSHSHQRGSGLFSSRRSSSQTWPVVCSVLAPSPGVRRVHHNSHRQPAMFAAVKTMMKMLCPVVTAYLLNEDLADEDLAPLRAAAAPRLRSPRGVPCTRPTRSARRTAPARRR